MNSCHTGISHASTLSELRVNPRKLGLGLGSNPENGYWWLVRPFYGEAKFRDASRRLQHIFLLPTWIFFLICSFLSLRFNMVAEEFFSSVYGPPLTSNTAIAKDVGIYAHSLWPTFAAKATFRKSTTPPHCLAVSESHIFAAQHEKAYVHVYSRLRGGQEAFVAFPERIRCLTLVGNVLVAGTVEGRIMLWEVCLFFPLFPQTNYCLWIDLDFGITNS